MATNRRKLESGAYRLLESSSFRLLEAIAATLDLSLLAPDRTTQLDLPTDTFGIDAGQTVLLP